MCLVKINSEIGYSSCSRILVSISVQNTAISSGNNYENGCMRIREIWSQSVPLLLAINFPCLRRIAILIYFFSISVQNTDESVFLEDLY